MWICDENATWSLFHCDSPRSHAFETAWVDGWWVGKSAVCHREHAATLHRFSESDIHFGWRDVSIPSTDRRTHCYCVDVLFIGWPVVIWMGMSSSTMHTMRNEEKWKIINTRHRLGDEHYTVEATHGVSSLLLTHCWLRYIMHKRI